MSNQETQSRSERGWLYWSALGVLIVLTVIALFSFSSARETARASEKADEFIAALEDAGLNAPSKEQITRVLGDDGGALCDDPSGALRRSIVNAQLVNGAAGPGTRPILADARRLLQGQVIALQVYCPDEVEDFRDFVGDLESAAVTGG